MPLQFNYLWGGEHLFHPNFSIYWKDILTLNLYMNILFSHYKCTGMNQNGHDTRVTSRVGLKVWQSLMQSSMLLLDSSYINSHVSMEKH